VDARRQPAVRDAAIDRDLSPLGVDFQYRLQAVE
jgi:hypothetical protein